MPKKNEKIYDDSKILYEIFRMRGLTVTQLCDVVFQSKEYVYKYLRRLKDEGLIYDRMDMQGKIRLSKVYLCTDTAIERLHNEGYIEKPIKAKDNSPPRSKMKYTILSNSVYAALMPYGIYIYDSREWKNKFGMDRNTIVRGGLRMEDGKEVALYLFFSPWQLHSDKNEENGAGISDSMIKKFKHEIKKFPQTNRIAVICYDMDNYRQIEEEIDSDAKMLVFEGLSIIPIGKNEFGYNLLRLERDKEERKSILESILNARLNEKHPNLEGNKQNFTQYVAEYDDKETYVVDFLGMNRPVLHHLSTHYHSEAFNWDGRQVDLLCWKPNEKELMERFKQYPHVNIISLSIDQLSEFISKMEKSKKL